VIDKLGEGAQGAVYLATDNKLERKVALKILLPHSLESEALYHRFILEARAAASLDHPNICTIYSIEEVNEQTLMAMAYLEGETVRQKTERGPLPLNEAIEFALQTLEGLDAAHKQGVVHRDIKSSNLMLVDQGLVKILDFGLAVAADRTRITATNTVLGPPSYMSPEQVRGETADGRSDLWSVGVVLHEMVTGKLPFRGENAHSVLNSILIQEPEPLTALRTGVPIELDRIVGKALAKSPKERYQHADDFSADLRLVQRDVSATSVTGPTRRLSQVAEVKPRWFAWIPWGIAAIATLALIIVTTTTRVEVQSPDGPVIRLSINLPEEAPLNIGMIDGGSMVISPDGRNLVCVGKSDEGTRLFRRSLDSIEIAAVPESVGARSPFFSPDSKWLGFFADNELFKSNLDGGSLRMAPVFGRRLGACWANDGTVYLGLAARSLKGPLEALSLDGEAFPLTELKSGSSHIYEQHSFPELLPNGRGLLFTSARREGGSAVLYDFETREQTVLIEDAIGVRFLPPGFLIISRVPDQLFAVEFDLDTLQTVGEPEQVLDGVWLGFSGLETWTFSDTGTLVYAAGNKDQYLRRLVWADRSGTREAIAEVGTSFLSPDSRWLAYVSDESGREEVYVQSFPELNRQVRVSFRGGVEPLWSLDGRSLYFRNPDGREAFRTSFEAGSEPTIGSPEHLFSGDFQEHNPYGRTWDLSSDGKRFLLFEQPYPMSRYELKVVVNWTREIEEKLARQK
jgi:serine/threonine-protein kinase